MTVRIVDRERELQRLQELRGAVPTLVVLRGRRRVGKSFLLRAALPGDRVVSLQAEQKPRALQLEALARECSRLLPGAPPLAFGDWNAALEFLDGQAVARGPLVVILDEFQYLAASDSALESIVQAAWDRWDANQTPIMLVLCGSALSFMAGLLGGSRPTFGRSAYRPLLQPLSYRDSAAFAPGGATPIELIERFGVLGGTPQYQRWAGARSLAEVIRQAILPTDAPLHSEPEHLVREEEGIREPGPYFGILESIAGGNTTPNAIASRLEISQQLTIHYLGRLEELAYVHKAEPLEPGGKGSARSYWKIADPYLRFWFRCVLPNRSRLARDRIAEVAAEIERDLPTFLGPVFEDCCRDWLGRHSPLGADALDVGSWWSRKHDLEIDVATLDKKGYGVLGSCKWWTKPAGLNVLAELQTARSLLGSKASQARLVLFSRSGFALAVSERATSENIHLFGPADLFA